MEFGTFSHFLSLVTGDDNDSGKAVIDGSIKSNVAYKGERYGLMLRHLTSTDVT